MPIITLTTDFGDTDYYVAAVKAKILSTNKSINIIDISHAINKWDIGHASYVLKNCYADFPEGTVHLVSINTTGHPEEKIIRATSVYSLLKSVVAQSSHKET